MTNDIPNQHFISNITVIGEEDEFQNQATHCFGLVLTEAWLFCKFFGMSERVVEILWELFVGDISSLRMASQCIPSEPFIF